jgi:hypothetical protein
MAMLQFISSGLPKVCPLGPRPLAAASLTRTASHTHPHTRTRAGCRALHHSLRPPD